MSSTTTTPTAHDAGSLARADRVVADLGLGADGIPVDDPATGERIATVPDLDVPATLDVLGTADRAGTAWARTSPRERADVLHAWYELLVAYGEDLAHLITREMGKPLAEARAEVAYGSDFVRWYAEEAVRPGGGYRDAPKGDARILTRRAPVGLAVLITPWNFPLAMATRKIAPAIAAGCAALVKPATATPLTTYLAVDLARRAGVPAELVQVVTTSSSSAFSEAVLRDERVRKVSFTGSTPVGRTLLGIAADRVLRTSMELGGNAPLIVFDDADLERAVDGAFAAKMRNGGQSCIAANRIYVQSGIARDFTDALTERLAGVAVGAGLAEGIGLGPLIDARAVEHMTALTADAVERGARLRTGGVAVDGPGHFFAPTLIEGVPADADVANEEIFGPVAAIQKFTSEQEAIERANATEFGLAGYVFTESLDRALDVADRLETGLVGINQGVPSNAAAPFGGVKQSGLGREGGAEGVEEYESIRFYNIARRPSA
ncbi:NAD-dependent succinate-semialdehyde dehydrogenase [Pseudoclavibacter chungangensis]|uniref:NAD-dependent succinate-semialdehyde dehydrogenase n=1 Tax=Pseudoclavibacter chungangensis TaxID=587635 RepID=A0A7J5C130_9MICO|nr:NAD-dependent succinate-semialdehyde dehydrogenase [Pseudoclavibacter chungangensis]KAB1662203.1 NAD-dependent succinate-semialdehyde dehydrogenase [Pseudoclavibacter chungangensis]NYJ65399.1 succinate-semialdehyde dehydrogenase/glutarate-semialdehyde dehydrogenase [Pseudoclavibacter chungangensis]